MPDRSPITGTYRLQLHAGFGFAAAAGVVPYLAELGVSHLYLSPVLAASPGSTHGYDVVDHSRVSDELGGRAGLVDLARRCRDHGLGVIVDVVPNHMAVPTPLWLNAPLWETLRDGAAAPRAEWFDIDWGLCDGRVGLPILGADLPSCIDRGELRVGHDPQRGPVLCYHDQRLPVRPGTEHGELADVLDRQHYLLASWRDKDTVLNYRRFFEVDTLIALRVEIPAVFDATHETLLALHADGVVDGFRIDHPDGLADPEGYLARLHDATGGAWVVVEKILVGDERLPASWRTAGTTGYDALARVQQAFAPPSAPALDLLWRDIASDPGGVADAGEGDQSLDAVELAAKRVAVSLLGPEVGRLARRAAEAAHDTSTDLTAEQARAVFEAMLPHVGRYRAYARPGEPVPRESRAEVQRLAARARDDRPDLAKAIGVVERLLLDSRATSAAGRDLVVRFQQVCGPVMAKGIEDTAFYRWHRFVALNEVGGDPAALERPGDGPLADWAARQQRDHPFGLTALSTHDTKRDEDARARLLAAGEDVRSWSHAWTGARDLATAAGVDHETAYLVLQTLIAAWPISAERLEAYLLKATREAKLHTSWVAPDEAYERRVRALVASCLDDGPLRAFLSEWTTDLTRATESVRLGQKLVQLTLPGVPDTYQGTELVQGFLVDPDNRRDVDFDRRARMLRLLDGRGSASGSAVGADMRKAQDQAKLWVTSRALRLRRDRPELFGAAADHAPLVTTSPLCWGFTRGADVATVVTRWPGRIARERLADATVHLPEGRWSDALSDAVHDGGPVAATALFARLPVALLVRG